VKGSTPYLVLVMLAVACFSLATTLQPRVSRWSDQEAGAETVLKVLLGDGRRIFANQAFVEADVYFHSGYYPSVFDQSQAPKDSRHMTAKEGSTEAEEHERQMNFLGTPRDWIERFGRHFVISEHTHLEGGREREILPWLKLSADLDPQRVDTYTVAAYWLRKELGKPAEAEQFLREGERNNPDSYEILFELGLLYNENYHDPNRARDLWELALRRWREREGKQKEPDLRSLEEIVINLARVEEKAGNLERAIEYLEMASKASPNPQALRQQIAELRVKVAAGSGAGNASPSSRP
jgi:tetratricopeptide (TPR) repeat protein